MRWAIAINQEDGGASAPASLLQGRPCCRKRQVPDAPPCAAQSALLPAALRLQFSLGHSGPLMLRAGCETNCYCLPRMRASPMRFLCVS